MATATAIKANILTYLDRVGSTDLLETLWFEMAHREIQRRYNWKAMETTGVLTLVAGTNNYLFSAAAAPADAWNWKEIRERIDAYLASTGAAVYTLQQTSIEEIYRLRKNYSAAVIVGAEPVIPKFAITGNTTIEMFPAPTTASVLLANRIFLVGWRYLVAPTAANFDWFTNNAEDYLLYRSLLESITYLSQPPDRVAIWENAAEKAFSTLLQVEKSAVHGKLRVEEGVNYGNRPSN